MAEPNPDPNKPPADDAFTDERKKLIDESKSYRKRAQEAEARIADLERKVISDEDRAALEEFRKRQATTEDDLLKKKGDFDAMLAKRQELFDKQVAAAKQTTDSALKAFAEVAVQQPILAALARRGVKDVAAAAFVLQGMHENRAVAELVDGKPLVRVVDRKGQPVIDAECAPNETITVAKMVEAFLATPTGQVYLPPSGDRGTGAHAQGGFDGVTIEQLDANPDKAGEFIAKHGQEAYLKLASGAWNKKRAQTEAAKPAR